MPLSYKRIFGPALPAGSCAPVHATTSAGVVVAASGPSAEHYPVGKKIAGSESIVLPAGVTLSVLDGNGTRVLRGAGTYSLVLPGGPSRRSTLAVLTDRRSARRTGIGASRGEDDGTP